MKNFLPLLAFSFTLLTPPVMGAENAGIAGSTGKSMDISKQIRFASADTTLDEAAKAMIDVVIIDLMASFSTVSSIVVSGHTDYVDSKKRNEALSLERAKSVKAYLVSRGFEDKLIKVEGKGWSQPPKGVECDKSWPKQKRMECYALMRRIDFHIEGTPKIAAGPALP